MIDRLRQARIVPVIRTGDPSSALETARRLLQRGLTVVELTATTPDWQVVLYRLRAEYPNATVGVGTVVTVADAVLAIESGAEFLVSPWPCPEVRSIAGRVPFLEGGFTPAEIAAATSRGVAKLFPAHLGGVSYLRSLLAVLPGTHIMPTGGIKPDQAVEWLGAGAIAVGVGSDLDRIPEVLDAL